MSNRGFDCTEDLTSHGGQIVQAGYEFVGRYYCGPSHNKTRLSRVEALHLSGLGLFLVTVFENNGNHAGYFTLQQGLNDGGNAFDYGAIIIRQPAGSPVYFAVDFDATESDIQQHIIPYFDGVRGSMHRHGGSAVGVYGSGFACRRLLELGLASHVWVAQSPGWAEYHTFNDWNLRQGATVMWNGISIDLDVSSGNGGGWQVR